jgi:thioredoxin 1
MLKKIMAIEFTDQNFDQEVLKSEKPVLVDFWAPWCGPCQIMGPIIDDLSGEVKDRFKVGKLNVDENRGIAGKYGVMSIPTLIIFKNGEVAKQFVGVQNKESLKEELEKV